MAFNRAGIKRLVVWNGTGTGTSDVIDLNIRTDAKLTVDNETVEDVRGRDLPLYTNFKIEATAHNIARPLGYYFIEHTRRGMVSAEAITAHSGSGVFLFTGSNALGIDFEYGFTGQERYGKLTLEAKYEKSTADAMIDSFATVTTPKTSFGLTEVTLDPEFDFATAQYYSPEFGLVQSKATSGGSYADVFTADEIKERSFVIKTVGRKNVYNRTIVDYLDVLAEYTIYNSSAAKLKAIKDLIKTNFAPGVKIQEKSGTATAESHVFDVGVLSLKKMAEFGETDRYIKLTFKGKIPLDQVSYSDATNTYTYTL